MKSKFICVSFSQVKTFSIFLDLTLLNATLIHQQILLVLPSRYIQNQNWFSSLHGHHHGQASIILTRLLARSHGLLLLMSPCRWYSAPLLQTFWWLSICVLLVVLPAHQHSWELLLLWFFILFQPPQSPHCYQAQKARFHFRVSVLPLILFY